jgi:hypothetical protein
MSVPLPFVAQGEDGAVLRERPPCEPPIRPLPRSRGRGGGQIWRSGVDRVLRNCERHVTAVDESSVVLGPTDDPILRLERRVSIDVTWNWVDLGELKA